MFFFYASKFYNFMKKTQSFKQAMRLLFALTKTQTKSCWILLHVEASKAIFLGAHRYRKNAGTFLTAMTIELYMTNRSFLTVFLSVSVSAPKTPCLLPRGVIFNRFCAVFMWARKKRAFCFKRLVHFP